MEIFDGRLRDEKDSGKDDDMFIAFTPMSQPFGDRPTFPPNARPTIYYMCQQHCHSAMPSCRKNRFTLSDTSI